MIAERWLTSFKRLWSIANDWNFLKVLDIDSPRRRRLPPWHRDGIDPKVRETKLSAFIHWIVSTRLASTHHFLQINVRSDSRWFSPCDLFRTKFDSKSKGWNKSKLFDVHQHSMDRLLVRLSDSLESSLVLLWSLSETTLDFISIESNNSNDFDRLGCRSPDHRQAEQHMFSNFFSLSLRSGHLQVYSSVFWPSTSSSLSSLTLASMLSIVLIDLFPISIAIFILIKSGDKSGCFRRTMISSVWSSISLSNKQKERVVPLFRQERKKILFYLKIKCGWTSIVRNKTNIEMTRRNVNLNLFDYYIDDTSIRNFCVLETNSVVERNSGNGRILYIDHN